MLDPAAPINDGVDGWMALCDDGLMADGFPCTGSAHFGRQLIRCSDASHCDVKFIFTAPEPNGPAVLISESGLFRVGGTPLPLAAYVGDALRRSRQVETLGIT